MLGNSIFKNRFFPESSTSKSYRDIVECLMNHFIVTLNNFIEDNSFLVSHITLYLCNTTNTTTTCDFEIEPTTTF